MNGMLVDYKFYSIIQEGLYGDIWRVKHIKENKFYALKLIKNHIDIADHEFKMLNLFSHTNVLACKEIIYLTDITCIIMDLCDTDLWEYITNNTTKIKRKRIFSLLHDILNGIEYIHSNGYVHGDLKMENILLKNGNVKLCDFATCKNMKNMDTMYLTESIGTRGMMSPEVKRDMITYASDIWNFGLIIKEILNYTKKNFKLEVLAKDCMKYSHKQRPSIIKIRETLQLLSNNNTTK